jgi:hypothetical protein
MKATRRQPCTLRRIFPCMIAVFTNYNWSTVASEPKSLRGVPVTSRELGPGQESRVYLWGH